MERLWPLARFLPENQNRIMANKYELRRRALKDVQDRSDNSSDASYHGGYTPPPPMDRRRITLALSLGLAVLIAALYVQTVGHQFTVCDDDVYIYAKPQIVSGLTWKNVIWAFSDAHEGNWHPLTWISHMFDFQTFGVWQPENARYVDSWAGGHHLISMVIHCVNAVLLFLALRLMTGTLWPSFVVAALFGVHPLRVESVAWAAERKDVLCGLFWMASMLAYAWYARRRPIQPTSFLAAFGIGAILTILFVRLLVLPNLSFLLSTLLPVLIGMAVVGMLVFTSVNNSASWLRQFPEIGSYLLITLLLALGLLSKSMIVTLPCVFMLLDIWPLRRWEKALSLPGREGMNGQVPAIDAAIGTIVMVVSGIVMGISTLGVLYVLAQAFSAVDLLVGGGVFVVGFLFFLLGYGMRAGDQRTLWTTFLLVEKIPWFAMVVGDCLMTVVGQDKGVALNDLKGLPMDARLLNAVVSCGEYLRQTVWPTGLAPFYAHPHMIPNGWTSEFYVRFGVYSALLVAITGAAIWFFRQRPFLAVGWFWYLGALMPVIGIVQVGTQARADRYTYLPMIGVYLMVAWLLKEVADRRPQTRVTLAAASVVVLVALSAVTFRQVSYWVDSYQLFEHAVQVTENNYFAYNHIGIAYDSDAKKMSNIDAKEAQKLFDHVAENFKGPPMKLDAALKQPLLLAGSAGDFKAAAKKLDPSQKQQLLFDYSADAFQATIDIKPNYDYGNNNLGVYYARKSAAEDLALAEKFFRGALMSNGRYHDAFNNLAIILRRQGKLDESIAFSKAGLGVRYDKASDHNNLCVTYMQKDDLENAMKENTIALEQCDPNFLPAWMSRAEIHLKQKNLDEAVKCIQRMTAIDAKSPETIQSQYMMAAKYLDLNRPDDAIGSLNQILKIHDAAPQIYNARGLAYLQKGDLSRAQLDFEQVVRLFPQFPGAQQNLNAIRARLAHP